MGHGVQVKEVLRREEVNLDFSRFTKGQLKVAEELVDAIADALSTSNQQSFEQRVSRVVILTGERGSGKSTVVSTLIAKIENRNSSEGGGAPELAKKIRANLQEGDQQVVFLKPLSLDPLPEGTNLLAAILARIEHAVNGEQNKSRQGGRRGIFDPVETLDRARHGLSNLRTEAVMAYESNIEHSKTRLDLDTYAIQVSEFENDKLVVPEKLNKYLSQIASGSQTNLTRKALYVLVVDDVDQRPSRAIEIVKLAYQLSIPRLFFVFVGSISVLDTVLFHQTEREFQEVCGDVASQAKRVKERIEETANTISSSLLRKLIPPTQRFEIEDLGLEDALNFSRNFESRADKQNESGDRLAALLDSYGGHSPFFDMPEYKDEKATESNSAPENKESEYQATGNWNWTIKKLVLDDLMKRPPKRDIGTSERKEQDFNDRVVSRYDATKLITSTPREVADLWKRLMGCRPDSPSAIEEKKRNEKESAEDNKKQMRAVFRELVSNFENLIDEEGELSVPLQEKLKTMAHRRMTGSWEFDPPHIRVQPDLGRSMTFAIPPDGRPATAKVHVREIRAFELVAQLDDGAKRFLGHRTRPAFKLLWDLAQFAPEAANFTEELSWSKEPIAYTEWNDGYSAPVRINWRMAQWRTFWHADTFARLWNDGLSRIRTAQRGVFAKAWGVFERRMANVGCVFKA